IGKYGYRRTPSPWIHWKTAARDRRRLVTVSALDSFPSALYRGFRRIQQHRGALHPPRPGRLSRLHGVSGIAPLATGSSAAAGLAAGAAGRLLRRLYLSVLRPAGHASR